MTRKDGKGCEARDHTGWLPGDYTSGPLEGIPSLLILPSVRLRESGLRVASEPAFLQALGVLEVLAAGRPVVERAGSREIYFSEAELAALLAMPAKETLSWLADEVSADAERVKAAKAGLARVRAILRRSKARSYRNERAALLEENLRSEGVPPNERMSIVDWCFPGVSRMALTRARAILGLPPRQKREK